MMAQGARPPRHPSNHRLTGVLFAVALALLAGTAQAQRPIQDPDELHLPPIDVPHALATVLYSPHTLPQATGNLAAETSLIYTLSPLPPGMEFDRTSRILSGTPTVVGTTQLIYRVQNGFNFQYFDTETFDFVVSNIGVLHLNILTDESPYAQGETITVRAIFNQPVTVTGSPILELTLDSGTVRMSSSNPGASRIQSLLFNYIIQSDDEDPTGISIGANALQLNGGSIIDEDGDPVDLSLAAHIITNDPQHKVDGVPPNIILPAARTIEATAVMTSLDRADYGTATSDDPNAMITDNAPAAFPLGPTTITWTAADDVGNEAHATQVVTVVDTTAPVIALLGANPQTVEFRSVYSDPGATATDAVDDNTELAIRIAIDASAVDTNQVGTYPVTYDVSDTVGNVADTVTRTVVVTQTTTVEQLLILNDDPVYTEYETLRVNVIFDQPVTVTGSPILELSLDSGVVRMSAGTSSAASATLPFTYVIQSDDEDPTGISIGANALKLNGGSIIDEDGDPVDLSLAAHVITDDSGTKVDGDPPRVERLEITSAPDNGYAYGPGEEITVLLVFSEVLTGALESLHLALSLAFRVTVTTHKTTRPADFPDRAVLLTYTVRGDNYDPDGISIVSFALRLRSGGSVTNAAGTPLILSLSGHTVTNHRSHRVDGVPPDIFPPDDKTIEATAALTPLGRSHYGWAFSFSDADAVITNDAPAAFPLGQTTITWTAADAAGNEVHGTQVVTVRDTTAPVITLTNDNADGNTVSRGSAYREHRATVTDAVDDNTELAIRIAIDASAVDTNRLGTYPVTYDVTDAAGNVADTVTRTVLIIDLTAPPAYTAEATAVLTPLDRSDYGSATSVAPNTDINDNAPAVFPLGETTITWTAVDSHGNISFTTQTITIIDTTKPRLTVPNEVTLEATGATTIVITGQAVATDLVTDPVLVTREPMSNEFTVGDHTITWSADDGNGNTATAEQSITITDTSKPVITLLDDNARRNTVSRGSAYREFGATATDLVDDDDELAIRIVVDASAVDTNQVGTYLVTYDVSDTATNVADTVTRTVTVIERLTVQRFLYLKREPYLRNQGLEILLHFDQQVTVTGFPTLDVILDSGTVRLEYAGVQGIPTTTPIFFHRVGSTDEDNTGLSIGADALRLNGGTMNDPDGNPIDISLAEVAFTDDPQLQVDGNPPRLQNFVVSETDFPLWKSQEMVVDVTFDQPVMVTGAPFVEVILDSGAVRLTTTPTTSLTSVVSFRYTIQATDGDRTGISIGANALQLNGGSIIDPAGNPVVDLNLAAYTITNDRDLTVDGAPPRVQNIIVSGIESPYTQGRLLGVSIIFDRPITVIGHPTLDLGLDTGTVRMRRGFLDVGVASRVNFRHAVQATDQDHTGVSVGADALQLHGGSIIDPVGNVARISLSTHAVTEDSLIGQHLVVDGKAPRVRELNLLSTGAPYREGDKIEVELFFDEPVTVEPAGLSLDLGLDTGTVRMRHTNRVHHQPTDARNRTTHMIFAYTVGPTDEDLTGISIAADALKLHGSSVYDLAYNPADLSLAAYAFSNHPDHQVDGITPRVQALNLISTNALYRADDKIEVEVIFQQPATVTGEVYLVLDLDTGNVQMRHTNRVDGPTTRLVFAYAVRPGDEDLTGLSIVANALKLSGGSRITDQADNPADLSLAAHAFINKPNTQVDARKPTVREVNVTGADSPYGRGETFYIEIVFDQPVLVTGEPQLEARLRGIAGVSIMMDYVNPSGDSASPSLFFAHTVRAMDQDPNGVSLYHYGLRSEDNGNTITDQAGNPAARSLFGHTFDNNPNLRVDGATQAHIAFTVPDIHVFLDEAFDDIIHPAATGPGVGDHENYRIDALPDGMWYDPPFRRFRGRLTELGTTRITILLVGTSASATFNFVVVNKLLLLSAPASVDTHAALNQPFDHILPAATGAATRPDQVYTVDQMPAGMRFDPQTRRLFGTPTRLGTTTMQYSVNIVIPADPHSPLTFPERTRTTTVTFDFVVLEAAEVTQIVHQPPPGDGYRLGDVIEVGLIFSRVVRVEGAPTLTLAFDRANVQAAYKTRGGATATRMDFTHTVRAQDLDENGFAVLENALQLNGGRIDDEYGNPADLVLEGIAFTGSSSDSVFVDGEAPRATSLEIISAPAQGVTYLLGETIRIRLRLNRPVTAHGSPVLSLPVRVALHGSRLFEPRILTYSDFSGAPRREMIFTYQVQDRDVDNDGISVGLRADGGMRLSGGRLTDDRPGQHALILALHRLAISNADAHQVGADPYYMRTGINRGTRQIFRATVTRGQPISPPIQLPRAFGGVGELTYDLDRGTSNSPDELFGVVYDPTTHTLSGTPTISSYIRTIYDFPATDSRGSARRARLDVELLILEEDGSVAQFRPLGLAAPNPSPLNFTHGFAVNYTFPEITGGTGVDPIINHIGDHRSVFGSLPPGLTFHVRTRRLSGTPTRVGNWRPQFSFTDQAHLAYDSQSGRGNFAYYVTMNVAAVPSFDEPQSLTLAHNQPLPDAPAAQTKLPTPRDGAPPFVYRLEGDLPPGVTFDAATRALSGTPTELGDTTLRYFATDTSGAVASVDFTFYVRDLTAPMVTGLSILSTPNGRNWYGIGDEIEVEVRFDEAVLGDRENLNLTLILNSGLAVAQYQVHENESRALFTYTVQEGDMAGNGIGIADNALNVARGGLADAAGNDVAGLALTSFEFVNNRGHKVDGVRPKVKTADIQTNPKTGDTYGAGEHIEVAIFFTEPVLHDDKDDMRLKLHVGEDEAFSQESLLGLSTFIRLVYYIQVGDEDHNGVSYDELLLAEGGRAVDVADNPAILTFPDDVIIADQAGHKVDTRAPQITAMRIISAPQQFGYYHAGERITARVDFSEPVTLGTGAPVLSMSLGDAAPRLIAMEYRAVRAEDDFLLFGYTVQAGDEDHNGVGIAADALEITGDMITDIAGNPLVLPDLSAFAFDNDARQKVDGGMPQVTGLSIISTPNARHWYGIGDEIEVEVLFSEAVLDDTENLNLTLTLDTGTVIAQYQVQENKSRAVFTYTVQAGDLDTTGVGFAADALNVTSGNLVDAAGNEVNLDLAPFAFENDPQHKVDGMPPDITAPDAMTFEATAAETPLTADENYDTATSTDTTATISSNAPDVFPLGETPITWTATDPAGNEMTAPQVVTVVDTTKPVIALLGANPQTVEFGTAYTELNATATDEVDDDITLTAKIVIDVSGVDTNQVGNHQVTYDVSDTNNNAADTVTRMVTVTDTMGPRVTSIEILPPTEDKPDPHFFKLHEPIYVRVHFDDDLYGDGGLRDATELRLVLSIDRNNVILSGTTQHSSGYVEFQHNVQPGNLDLDGLSIGADALSVVAGGSVADRLGNGVNLREHVVIINDPTRKVDGVPPAVRSAYIAGNPDTGDTYRAGEEILVFVTFEERFLQEDMEGLRLKLNLGATEVITTEQQTVSLPGVNIEQFRYTVQDGDYDPDGISFNELHLAGGGSVTDPAGNPLPLIFPDHVAVTDHPEHKVDAVAPQVTNVSITSRPQQFGYYVAGERITARVDFSEPVTVADGTTPVLQMSLGDVSPRLVAMEYETAQAGDDSMLFGYTVQTGDEDHNGIGIAADALEVTGGDPTTVTDAVGNPAVLDLAAFAIENDPLHKVDGAPPDITAPADMTIEATAVLTPLTADDYSSATSTDGTADISSNAPPVFPLGETTITWTATDPAGNEMMDTQVVTVVDTTKPVIALLGANPQTVEFGSIYNDPGATATDTVDDNDELTTQIAAASTVDTDTVGDYTVTYTVSDKATNAATPVIRTVTVEDTAAPDIIAPNTYTTEATATLTPLGRSDYGIATSSDSDAMITDDAPDAFPLGATTITWTATDKSTNEMMDTQVVTIVDTTKPDIAAPENITKEATGPTTPVTVGLATATDLVADPVIITRDLVANEFAVGTHTITWKADDDNGNIITAEQTITITDTTKPVIALLGDNPQTVEFGSVYTDPGATATDAVDDNDELTTQIAAASTVDTDTVGDYTVTYTVSDKATNAATPVIRMVTVTDTEAPDIIAPADITFEATDTLTPLDRSDYGIATSTDGTANITDDAPPVFPLGPTTITWTATDKSTNEMMDIQVVTIVDTTKPDIAAPGNIIKEATGPTTPVTVGLATATDLVTDPVTITRTPTGNDFTVGTHTITWKADDDNGNIITAEQTITITDTTKPSIALLGDNPQTVEFGSTYTDPDATATDLVDDDLKLTEKIHAVSTVDTGTVGDYTVTYTVSDTATNAATPVLRIVTVTDTAAPDITAPADITFEATDTLTPLDRTHYGIATSTDDTADITDDAPPVFPLGNTPITWRATDTNSLFSTAAQTITITDTTAPDIAAPGNITKEATGPTTPVTVGLATATDLVADPVIITRAPEADAFAVGTHTITWKADDDNGNISTAEQTITITDTTKPVIVLLGDNPQTVEFGSIYNDPGATATDAVDDNDELTTQIAAASTVDTGTVGDYTIIYTVSDKATNAATPVLRMVTVTDTAAPDITAPADITFEATDTLTPLDRSHYGTATSGDDTADITDDAPLVFPLGATTITWTATDKSTNEMMATQVVTVVDTTKPDIAAPRNITKEATGPTTPVTVGLAIATDLVTDPVIITRTPEGNEFAVGVHKIIWTADDDNGNIITAEQTITITDTTKPVITLTNDNADSNTVELGSAYTEHGATATDAVDDNTELTRRIAINAGAVDVNRLGTYPVTYDVSDTEGNPAERVTRMVMVTDTTEPDITAPADITLEATDTLTPLGRTHYGIATSSDDTAKITDDALLAFPLGDTTITWTATDKSTNEMMATQVVTVVDTTKPDIAAPRNITKEATGPTTPVTVGLATATDLVTDPVIITRTPEGNDFTVGTHTITWKADDGNGNIITAEQTITITDTTKPVIALLGDNPQTVEFGSIYNDPGATATDAVDDNDELTIRIAAISTVDTGTVGDYTVTYTVSDKATNAATPVLRMVTVTDTEAPDIIAPAAYTTEATATLTPLGRTHYGTATSTDGNADITDDAPDAFPLGDTTITWTATDKSTNEMMDTQVVTIVDTTKPDIAAPRNITKEATGPTTPVTVGLATATDLVTASVTITRSPTDDAFAVGTHTITWKADDGNGNISTAEQTVTITDTTAPVIVLLGADPQTVEFGSVYTDPGATATDAVDDNDELTTQIAAASTVDTGTVGDYTVTYTVSDKATNAATPVLRMVTVTDTAAPDITAPNTYTTEATDTLTPLDRSDYGTATSTDGNAMITDDAPPVFPLGPTTITWTATDKSNNEDRATQVVTVVDTTKPDITAPRNITKEATGPTTPVTVGLAIATDLVTDPVIITRSPTDDAFAVGTHTITWKADDDNGNIITAAQTITITDTTKPVIVLLGADPQTVEFGSIYNDPGATATDAVDDNDELTTQIAAASTVNTGTVGDYTVTYTVSDTATNAATPVIRMVIVPNTAAPDISPPADITFEATDTLTPLDRSDYGIATSGDDTADITDDAPDAFPLGATTITWTATDPATNEMIATQVVTIVDTTKPVIALLGADPQTVEFGTTYTELNATATDEVDDDDELTRRIAINAGAVDVNRLGTYPVTYDVSDAEGNNADRVTRTVMVTDTTAPDITAPLAMTFEATDTLTPLSRSDYGTATSGDDTADITDDAPDAFPLGATTITWTATDPATNEMMATQVVTIVDTTPPDIALLGDNPQTVEFGSIYNDPGATATDAVDDNDELTTQIAAVSTVDTGTVGDYTVTYDVTDTATNAATPVLRMVTVTDTAAPTITAPADITLEATDTLTPLGRTHYGTATSTDREAMITDDAPPVFSVGVHTITWTATDTNTLFSTAAQTITITDTTAPDITAPENITKEATGPTTPVTVGLAIATDLVTASVTITRTPEADAFAVGTHTITWKADDDNGNIITAEQTITITDTTKPVIALLGDNPQTVEFGSVYTDPGATATDLVDDDLKLTEKIDAASTVDTGTVGDYTVTYTVSDKATNAATPVLRTVTVEDTAAPDITAPDTYTTEATATLTPLDRTHYGTATSTDGNADITDDAPDAFPLGDTTITWTATDKSTNEMMDTQVVTVVDTTKPDIAAPRNITKEATGPTTPVTVGWAIATDLVTDPVRITRSPEGNEFAVGTHTITWKADDGNGNIITAAQTITITDTTKPVIVLLGDNPQTVEFGSIYNDPGATATDAVDDDDELTIRIAAVSTVDTDTVGDYTVTYTVSDKATNAATPVIRMVTVTDTAAPTITAPADITLEATDTLTPLGRTHYGTATSTDREAMITDDAPLAFPVGVHTITWTATDTNTLFSTAAQTITITDTTAPDITAPRNITKEATGPTTPVTVGLATATDLVTDPVIITRSPEGNAFAVGTHTITWKADDDNGNIITAAQTITITDTTAPVIVLLGDNPQTVEFGSIYNDPGATATDAVDDNDELTTQIAAASTVNTGTVGDYTVTYTVSDKATNAATPVLRTVTVEDTAAPDIIAPNTYTTEATATLTPLDRSDYGIATSSDDTAKITDDAPPVFPLGPTTITWTATDPATNEMMATQVVTIVDTTKPVIALLGADPQTVEFGTTYTELNATATDEVDDDDELTRRIVIDANAVDVDLIGTYAVTYDVTDAEGNAADRVTRMVMVTDTTEPDITAPLAMTFEATDTLTPLSRSDYGTATSGDDTADITDDAPDAFPLGATTITWTATDKSNNEARATQVVTVQDTTKPVIALLDDNTVSNTVEFGSVYNDPGATATDAVDDDVKLTEKITATGTVDTGTVGNYPITYNVSDDATNAATPVIRMVTVTDTAAPDITAPAAYATEATAALTPLSRSDYGIATSGDDTADITDDAPDAFPLGDTTITWTATDKSTNEMMATQVVTIVDTTKPDIAAPRNITTEATGPTTPVTVGLAIATDLVTDPVIITRTPEADAFAVGTHTITWKADDGNGNIITAEQTITITDTTKPSIALLGDNPQTVEFGSTYTDPDATATDLVDDDIKLTEKIHAVSTVDTGTVGDYTVTYTVSDTATNAATPVLRMVTVTDTAAPDITAPAAYTTEATATLTPLGRTHYGTATSTDGNADITDDAPDAFPLGDTTITWTATDKSTNEMMDTQVVTVVDTTKPDIAAPRNITKEATGPTTPVTVGWAIATDLVTDPVRITRSPEGNEFAVGTHTITWKADDDNGNIITAEQTITITDTTKPSIALLGDNPQTVEFGSVYTDPGATATDLVDDNEELTTQIAAISTVDTGTVGDYTVTYTVSDKATNAATPVLRTVTVEDTAAPDITAPDTYTTEATATLTPLDRTHYGTATSTDGNADITDDAPDAFPLGDTTITWTATDKSTNEMMDTQVVTVVDTTKPDIAAPRNITKEATGPTTPVTVGQATATDLVTASVTITRTPEADAFAVGTHTITWKADDDNGNIITAEQTITITDTTKPRIVLLGDNPQTVEFGSVYNDPGATATDAVDDNDELTTQIAAASTVDTGTVGDYTITYTVSDTATNAATPVLRTVTVEDTAAPDITAPDTWATHPSPGAQPIPMICSAPPRRSSPSPTPPHRTSPRRGISPRKPPVRPRQSPWGWQPRRIWSPTR